MIWERDPLWSKAKVFFARALHHRDDDEVFGLWCSLALELLVRAAVASVSSTLLSEPDRDQRNLLHALGAGPALTAPKSITTSQAVALCQLLFAAFTKEDGLATAALTNRRNAELHTAEAAFASYPSKQWLPGFYRASTALCSALGEPLENFVGKDEAQVAVEILKQSKESVFGKVQQGIAAYRKVFNERSQPDQDSAKAAASKLVATLVFNRHHKVTCPACGADATVEGDEFGPEALTHDDGEIVVRQSVTPRSFNCPSCGFKLSGYAELDAADLGGTYTRTTTFSPEEYYGLIDPTTADMSEYVNEYLEKMGGEYDNE